MFFLAEKLSALLREVLYRATDNALSLTKNYDLEAGSALIPPVAVLPVHTTAGLPGVSWLSLGRGATRTILTRTIRGRHSESDQAA